MNTYRWALSPEKIARAIKTAEAGASEKTIHDLYVLYGGRVELSEYKEIEMNNDENTEEILEEKGLGKKPEQTVEPVAEIPEVVEDVEVNLEPTTDDVAL